MQTRLRYNKVHVADVSDDQLSASEIADALSASVTQEDLQEFFLSQIKRIIHGDSAGNWFTDFIDQGTLSLKELSVATSMPANCLSGDTVGDVVYVSGGSIGGVVQVARADITDWSEMPGMGIIVSKSAPTDCVIVRQGLVTLGSLLPGKLYFLGSDSRPTSTPPTATIVKVFVQPLGVAMDVDRLLFRPSFKLSRVIP